jgi:hypothetical protein
MKAFSRAVPAREAGNVNLILIQISALWLSIRTSHPCGAPQDRITLGIRKVHSPGAIGRLPCDMQIFNFDSVLIGDTANRTYGVQSVPEEETMAEGNVFLGGVGFEKAGSES